MKIEELKVTNKNIMEILTDEDVYAIKRAYDGGYRMVPIGESEVKVILSEDTQIVRITND